MQEVFLGAIIRKKRLEMGLTQEELCEGICEPITISRMENGKQTPSRNRINAILERLDLPADRYFALLSQNELDVEQMQKEIIALNVRFSHATGEERAEIREKALEAHQKLEAIMEKDDTISRQLMLRSNVLLGKADGSKHSFQERIAMLTEAIRMTVPSFDLDEIGKNLYTSEEIKIINQLANTYALAGEHMEAIGILSQLYKYIQKHFKNIPLTRVNLNMVAHNYARELAVVGQYDKAIQIAQEGQRICIYYEHSLFLPGLLAIMAECHYLLGNREISLDLYWQAYYLYKAVGNDRDRAVLQKEMVKYFGTEFEL